MAHLDCSLCVLDALFYGIRPTLKEISQIVLDLAPWRQYSLTRALYNVLIRHYVLVDNPFVRLDRAKDGLTVSSGPRICYCRAADDWYVDGSAVHWVCWLERVQSLCAAACL